MAGACQGLQDVNTKRYSRLAAGFAVLSALVMLSLLLPLTPGTQPFFFGHAIVWCLVGCLVNFQRKVAWEAAGLPEGPPGREEWSEPYPAWAFEAVFLIHLIDFPLTLEMARKVCFSREAIYKAATMKFDDMSFEDRHGSSCFLEHYIFASHFGVFMADFIVHFSRPSAMFIGHHLAAMLLAWCGSIIGVIPGIKMLAFCSPLLEVGSSGYTAWVLWRMRGFYKWSMNISNLVYFGSIVSITYCAEELTYFFDLLVLLGLGLIVGRSYMLVLELGLLTKIDYRLRNFLRVAASWRIPQQCS